MAHVELSLSDPLVARIPSAVAPSFGALRRWSTAVHDAVEPCLVIGGGAEVVAISPAGCDLLGIADPADLVGIRLVDGALQLIDFTAAQVRLGEAELAMIPPLLALSSGRLSRGLLRVRARHSTGRTRTVDAIATPLWDGPDVVGSLTFFCDV